MPARRHRYGGGYGRRRRRRTRLFAGLALAVLVAAALGLWATRKGSPAVVVAPCPSPSVASPRPLELPAPRDVRLALLNGTPRNGLANDVADQLAAQGFVVLTKGNAPAALGGPSQVAYGQGAQPAARALSFHVLGAVLVPDPALRPGAVQLTLGGDFARLATPAEAAAAQQAATGPAAAPASTASASPRPCRS
jgi:hypothetical protein